MCDYLQSVPKCAVSVVYKAPCVQSLAVRNGERLSHELTGLHGVIFLDRPNAFLLFSLYHWSYNNSMRHFEIWPQDTEIAWNYVQHFV